MEQRRVEYTSPLPSAVNLVTKEGRLTAFCMNAPGVVGNPPLVSPQTYALRLVSTAIPQPISVPVPPRYVEYNRAEPVGFNFVTNASMSPSNAVW